MMDGESKSDTWPDIQIQNPHVTVAHEATVGRISDDQLFYMGSRGFTEDEAAAMIVNGFIEPVTKELPMEYAVELNRLIQLEMVGCIGWSALYARPVRHDRCAAVPDEGVVGERGGKGAQASIDAARAADAGGVLGLLPAELVAHAAYVKAWHERYCEDGLRTIGVHCPGFDPSREEHAVRDGGERGWGSSIRC